MNDRAAETLPHPTSGFSGAGVAVATLFVIAAVVWRLFVELGTTAVTLTQAVANGVDLTKLSTAEMTALVGPGALGVSFLVMATGLVAIGVGLALWQRWTLSRVFALRSGPWPALVVALLGGLTVGLFPGWLAEVLPDVLPEWANLGGLEALSQALADGTALGRIVLGLAVVIGAPFLEEAIFRGFLWGALERSLPPVAVWLVVSVLFALFHLDPVHVIAIGFTALFLGWLRMVSGSIWPGIVAHLVNNLWAAVAGSVLPAWVADWLTWWVALLAAGITVVLAGFAWLGRRRDALPPAPGATSL